MEKKLPSVFANKEVRNNNNETVYYSQSDVKKDRPSLIGKNVREKINSIFSGFRKLSVFSWMICWERNINLSAEEEMISKMPGNFLQSSSGKAVLS